ncbi:MAG: EamA family transporter RarD [Deltaproteobacteria bacterium]|nr:EamA family transporter RarD [Deltaproteobacteria bacterium]
MVDKTTSGTVTTISAFLLWGFFPIYWKILRHVPATQILAHRVIWSLVFLAILLSIHRRWREVKIFTDQIVECSLGYFINPLVNIFLGMVFLRERLYRWQMLSLILALTGVLFLILQYGRLPWIALVLAFTFGTYGLLRKTSRAGSMVGLFFDTAVLAPVFLTYLIILASHESGAFLSIDPKTDILLMGSGIVTAVPLLLFAHGARRIQYSAVGFFQYIAPTGQLLIGVLLYGEPFTSTHAVSFGLVWTAIVIYSYSTFALYKGSLPPSKKEG